MESKSNKGRKKERNKKTLDLVKQLVETEKKWASMSCSELVDQCERGWQLPVKTANLFYVGGYWSVRKIDH